MPYGLLKTSGRTTISAEFDLAVRTQLIAFSTFFALSDVTFSWTRATLNAVENHSHGEINSYTRFRSKLRMKTYSTSRKTCKLCLLKELSEYA